MDFLAALRDRIQHDVNGRGLRADPANNLCDAHPGDFAAACRSLAETRDAHLAIVTGFLIPTATPPAAETDGPAGALLLARALAPLGVRASILADDFCQAALAAGRAVAGPADVALVTLPPPGTTWDDDTWRGWFADRCPGATHLLALERVGPSHDADSIARNDPAAAATFLAEVPLGERDRCRTMRGRDVTALVSPAHRLFETTRAITLGVGDGGNEIGMGRIRWSTIYANITNGGLIACRTPSSRLIVAGVSNWGAYALAAGVLRLRGASVDDALAPDRELRVLEALAAAGLVDGVTNRAEPTVDGQPFSVHADVLRDLTALVRDAR